MEEHICFRVELLVLTTSSHLRAEPCPKSRRLFTALCSVAQTWIARIKPGYGIVNLEEFRECEWQIRGIVRFLTEPDVMTPAIEALRDKALEEHRDGEALPFL